MNVTGLWWHGPERIARTHGTAFRSYFAGAALTEERLEARALGPGGALARARVRMEGQIGPDGAPAGARRTMLLAVCALGEDGWRISAVQNTDIVEQAETMLAGADGLSPARYG